MFRVGILGCTLTALTLAKGFTFAIGSPVAAQDYAVKSAAFVFRTDGCEESAKPQVSGTAEGLVQGARKTVSLIIRPSSKPGVYAVFQTWPAEGDWVINLKGTCGADTAGALIPIGPRGFVREASKFFPRPATDSEIDAALKARSEGGAR